MATLTLDRVWINLMATGEAVAAYSADRDRKMSVDGEMRTYGAGRRRSVTKAGRVNVMAFKLLNLSSLEVVQLERWLGLEVMYRDWRGQRFVGAYYGIDFTERGDNKDRYHVGLTLHEETWTEGVA